MPQIHPLQRFSNILSYNLSVPSFYNRLDSPQRRITQEFHYTCEFIYQHARFNDDKKMAKALAQLSPPTLCSGVLWLWRSQQRPNHSWLKTCLDEGTNVSDLEKAITIARQSDIVQQEAVVKGESEAIDSVDSRAKGRKVQSKHSVTHAQNLAVRSPQRQTCSRCGKFPVHPTQKCPANNELVISVAKGKLLIFK